MDPNTFPTKGNLIAAKNSLGLAIWATDSWIRSGIY